MRRCVLISVVNALLQLYAYKPNLGNQSCWCVLLLRHSQISPAMYEAFFSNKFTNSLVYYVILLILVLISPFLFIWELITALRSCFQPIENMLGKVVLITGASSGLGEVRKP